MVVPAALPAILSPGKQNLDLWKGLVWGTSGQQVEGLIKISSQKWISRRYNLHRTIKDSTDTTKKVFLTFTRRRKIICPMHHLPLLRERFLSLIARATIMPNMICTSLANPKPQLVPRKALGGVDGQEVTKIQHITRSHSRQSKKALSPAFQLMD
jgi:hypothetical protein